MVGLFPSLSLIGGPVRFSSALSCMCCYGRLFGHRRPWFSATLCVLTCVAPAGANGLASLGRSWTLKCVLNSPSSLLCMVCCDAGWTWALLLCGFRGGGLRLLYGRCALICAKVLETIFTDTSRLWSGGPSTQVTLSLCWCLRPQGGSFSERFVKGGDTS